MLRTRRSSLSRRGRSGTPGCSLCRWTRKSHRCVRWRALGVSLRPPSVSARTRPVPRWVSVSCDHQLEVRLWSPFRGRWRVRQLEVHCVSASSRCFVWSPMRGPECGRLFEVDLCLVQRHSCRHSLGSTTTRVAGLDSVCHTEAHEGATQDWVGRAR